VTGGFYCSAASALLPLSARRPISLLVLLTSAPSGERQGSGQQHTAAQTAERELPIGAVEIQEPARLALFFELGDPFHQQHPVLQLSVLIHDFDIGPVHRGPADRIGEPRILVRHTHVQLHQMVFRHLEELELNGGRAVVLGPVDLPELVKEGLRRGRRRRPVGSLPGQDARLELFMDHVVRLIIFIEAVARAVVDKLQVGAREGLGMARGAGLDPRLVPLHTPGVKYSLANPWHEGIIRPPHLPHGVVAELPLVLKMAALAGRELLPALHHHVLHLKIPIPPAL